MRLTDPSYAAWQQFLNNTDNLGHAERSLQGGGLEGHVNACWASAQATAARVREDIHPFVPHRILEVGASAGLNCFALAEAFPNADVIGIEPEGEAVRVAKAMESSWKGKVPNFLEGVGEALPLLDESVDLILCHTVIEHVQNVEMVIGEMSRVLAPGGVIHLEAPNYMWPYEPHLEVWCLPLLGKSLVRLSTRLQGRGSQLTFLEHLQFVHPAWLERVFRANKLEWENRAEQKITAAMSGNTGSVRSYRRLAYLLGLVSRFGLGRIAVKILVKTRLYPSVLYTLRKNRAV